MLKNEWNTNYLQIYRVSCYYGPMLVWGPRQNQKIEIDELNIWTNIMQFYFMKRTNSNKSLKNLKV